MNRKRTLGTLAAAAVVFAGCELNVANPNAPDRARALASPDDVETLIGSAYGVWWQAAHHWNGHGPAFGITADHASGSWGNFGMRDFNEEPRKAFDNNPSYGNSEVAEDPWGDSYASISASSDGLRSIDEGLEIGPGGERNPRAIAWAKFNQGVGHCTLANVYDKAFIIDENTDLQAVGDAVDASTVLAAALAFFDEAIAVAGSNSFSLERSWLPELALTNTELVRLARSYKARCRANQPRWSNETASVDWASVVGDVDAGITEDLKVLGDQISSWWDGYATYGYGDPGWVRADMHWIGLGDTSGNYEAWINTPVAQRQAFDVTSPDQRIAVAGGGEGFPSVATWAATGDPYTEWYSTTPHPPSRGTYTLSRYVGAQHRTYTDTCDQCWFGPMMEMGLSEMQLLKADALMQMGNMAGAAAIINVTRAIGGLMPMGASGTAPDCIPHPRYDGTGACGDLEDALLYEFMFEAAALSAGLNHYMNRRHGSLVPGTVLQLPVPGRELEVLEIPIYTFGGGGPGSAPPSVTPGDLDSSLRRVSFTLEAIERKLDAGSLSKQPRQVVY